MRRRFFVAGAFALILQMLSRPPPDAMIGSPSLVNNSPYSA